MSRPDADEFCYASSSSLRPVERSLQIFRKRVRIHRQRATVGPPLGSCATLRCVCVCVCEQHAIKGCGPPTTAPSATGGAACCPSTPRSACAGRRGTPRTAPACRTACRPRCGVAKRWATATGTDRPRQPVPAAESRARAWGQVGTTGGDRSASWSAAPTASQTATARLLAGASRRTAVGRPKRRAQAACARARGRAAAGMLRGSTGVAPPSAPRRRCRRAAVPPSRQTTRAS